MQLMVTSDAVDHRVDSRTTMDDLLPDVDAEEDLAFHKYTGGSRYSKRRMNCWCCRGFKSLTNLEKILLFLVAILSIFLVVKLAMDGSSSPGDQCSQPFLSTISPLNQNTTQPCVTRDCIEIASRVALSLDETMDPCQDFHQFACGGWQKRNPLPPGHSIWSTFNTLWKDNQAVMKQVLEANVTSQSSAERKAKAMYRSCLDMDSINAAGGAPLLSLINKFGGWSVLGSVNLTEFDFNKTLKSLAPLSVFPFFDISVDTDGRKSNSNVITISEGGLTAGSREFYINKTIDSDPILSATLEYMTTIATLLGGEKDRSGTQMRELLELEGELAKISQPLEEQRDEEKNYNKVSLGEMKDIAPAVDWLGVFPSAFKDIANITVDGNEPVVVLSINYLRNVSDIVYKTSPRVLQNYVIWHVVKSSAGGLGQPFIDAENKLAKVKFGADFNCLERWRYCLDVVDGVVGQALGRLFVREEFDERSKQSAEEMVTAIKSAFQRNLDTLQWMDPITKQRASDKAKAVEDLIGFSDDILNTTYIDIDYKELKIPSPPDFFTFHLNSLKFMVMKILLELRKPVKRDDWSITPPTVNAYYSPHKNIIVFPAGILRPPFYSAKSPKAMNFGGIGVVVGHELTHGFDDQGCLYDKSGNLDNWWQNSTLVKFHAKTECMAKQYSDFQIHGLHVNGNLTVGENIADNGGLKLAYNAYQAWKTSHPSMEVDMLLPSLNYTHDQLFFISFSQMWCSVETLQHLRNDIITNFHSPPKFRIIGTLTNSKEFAEAFQCPSGSPMNPKDKCTVW